MLYQAKLHKRGTASKLATMISHCFDEGRSFVPVLNRPNPPRTRRSLNTPSPLCIFGGVAFTNELAELTVLARRTRDEHRIDLV